MSSQILPDGQTKNPNRHDSRFGFSDDFILFSLNEIALPKGEVSRLRARSKGFPIIVAPLSTSAYGGLATGEPSPFENLRDRPLAAMLFIQHSIRTGR